MPIYEYYCRDCHMIFNFFSKSVNTEKMPLCPKCGKTKLNRRMSVFATSHNLREDGSAPLSDLDGNKMERAMNLLAKEAEQIDESDPRQTANLMRKLTDMTGLNLGSSMEEALKRMESGENPEEIEAEMGDMLENEEPFALKKNLLKATGSSPPGIDDKLYDL